MKKIFLFMGFAAGILLTSCSGFLDTEPSVELKDDDAITTVQDLQNAVNGVAYRLIDYDNGVRFSYTSEFGIYADILTNDFKVGVDMGQTTAISNYLVTQNDNYPKFGYNYYYGALGNVNKSLSYVPQVEGDEAEINDLKGQLLTWRALLHFDLARMFCHIPASVQDVNAENTGLVLADQVYPADYKGKRSTLKATYDFIIKDLTDAMPLLSKSVKLGSMNYWVALSLRARAYLYAGDYANALKDAQEVINSNVYKLYTIADYPGVWDKEGTSEAIFELRVNDNHNNDRYSVGYYNSPDGYAECVFNEKSPLFLYLSNAANNDVRSQLVNDQTSHPDVPGYYSGKYPGRGGSVYVNNFKIVRLSELYLIAAEAAFHLNGGAAAAPFINQLRQNRITGYTDVSSVTLDDILFEYEKEFFTENQIAFAYWRNKRSVTSRGGTEVKYNDDRTILPIPQREIDFSGKDVLIQNPGYE
ncbi:RagB/SusD family nutrient uptake outer membrane protein [Prevotella sp. kh1p2]|uniref:RagB/SusD family nutrient uptake outer membrane protein n=1 Tax=Prevotella sp. kh1p2 TaxID=1761883 RepID=UPI0008B084B8|nr:RagB/SusD family nutrient uptake outer membrane protein [Prevotella sp. kh1p2]SES83134.1 SusD family protein [Prevotella sp. kh1p2]SNU10826.1 SusD family protein [Prevotellaceae bacterium KH2P17]